MVIGCHMTDQIKRNIPPTIDNSNNVHDLNQNLLNEKELPTNFKEDIKNTPSECIIKSWLSQCKNLTTLDKDCKPVGCLYANNHLQNFNRTLSNQSLPALLKSEPSQVKLTKHDITNQHFSDKPTTRPFSARQSSMLMNSVLSTSPPIDKDSNRNSEKKNDQNYVDSQKFVEHTYQSAHSDELKTKTLPKILQETRKAKITQPQDWSTSYTANDWNSMSSSDWGDEVCELDRQESIRVQQMFDAIDCMLFEPSFQLPVDKNNSRTKTASAIHTVDQNLDNWESSSQDLVHGLKQSDSFNIIKNLHHECQEWTSKFPHLRLRGTNISCKSFESKSNLTNNSKFIPELEDIKNTGYILRGCEIPKSLSHTDAVVESSPSQMFCSDQVNIQPNLLPTKTHAELKSQQAVYTKNTISKLKPFLINQINAILLNDVISIAITILAENDNLANNMNNIDKMNKNNTALAESLNDANPCFLNTNEHPISNLKNRLNTLSPKIHDSSFLSETLQVSSKMLLTRERMFINPFEQTSDMPTENDLNRTKILLDKPFTKPPHFTQVTDLINQATVKQIKSYSKPNKSILLPATDRSTSRFTPSNVSLKKSCCCEPNTLTYSRLLPINRSKVSNMRIKEEEYISKPGLSTDLRNNQNIPSILLSQGYARSLQHIYIPTNSLPTKRTALLPPIQPPLQPKDLSINLSDCFNKINLSEKSKSLNLNNVNRKTPNYLKRVKKPISSTRGLPSISNTTSLTGLDFIPPDSLNFPSSTKLCVKIPAQSAFEYDTHSTCRLVKHTNPMLSSQPISIRKKYTSIALPSKVKSLYSIKSKDRH